MHRIEGRYPLPQPRKLHERLWRKRVGRATAPVASEVVLKTNGVGLLGCNFTLAALDLCDVGKRFFARFSDEAVKRVKDSGKGNHKGGHFMILSLARYHPERHLESVAVKSGGFGAGKHLHHPERIPDREGENMACADNAEMHDDSRRHFHTPLPEKTHTASFKVGNSSEDTEIEIKRGLVNITVQYATSFFEILMGKVREFLIDEISTKERQCQKLGISAKN